MCTPSYTCGYNMVSAVAKPYIYILHSVDVIHVVTNLFVFIYSGSRFEYISNDQGNPRLLGYGSYGDVYLARERKSKEMVAMKMFRRSDTSMKTVFREAAYACVLARQECAPKFYGLVKVNASKYYQPLALAVEFIGCKKESPCDLTRLMTTPYTGNSEGGFENHLTSHQWIRLLLQLAKEIHKCHKANIVLIDLKEDNILVRDPESNAMPLLADFGLAVHNCRRIPNFGRGQLDKPDSFWDFPHYAPELCDTNEVSPAADIYSFGCILARVGGVVLGGRVPSLNYLAADCTARDPAERPDGLEVIERLKQLDKVFERRAGSECLL